MLGRGTKAMNNLYHLSRHIIVSRTAIRAHLAAVKRLGSTLLKIFS